MPTNRVARITPMIVSVVAAFLARGSRNAGTPSAMASMPVRATAPEEKPRSSRNSVRLPPIRAPWSSSGVGRGMGSMCPKNVRNRP